jgi:hypothetical protein
MALHVTQNVQNDGVPNLAVPYGSGSLNEHPSDLLHHLINV